MTTTAHEIPIEQLRARLGQHVLRAVPPVPGRTNHIAAAVLVPLIWDARPRCLLTERTATLRMHPGEVSFPGGRPEAIDEDLRATALRETREEIGVRAIDVVGELSSMPLATSDHRLYPYVGLIDEREIVPSPDEVEAVHTLDIGAVLEAREIEAIEWQVGAQRALVPLFEVGGKLVYGGTAAVLHECLCVLAPLFGAPTPKLVRGERSWQEVLARVRAG